MKFQITLAILAGCLSTQSLLQAMQIKQARYAFNMDMAQDITCETFVVTDSPASKISPSPPCKIPAVHFQKHSWAMDSAESNSILSAIETCRLTRETPLVITGFTCHLGPDQFNQTLSLQRAKTVATLLQTHGFTVATVQGKGSQNLITLNRRDLSKNRRVEIEPTH